MKGGALIYKDYKAAHSGTGRMPDVSAWYGDDPDSPRVEVHDEIALVCDRCGDVWDCQIGSAYALLTGMLRDGWVVGISNMECPDCAEGTV